MKRSCHVVAVAGPIGGGKTSLAQALVNALGDAVMVCWDHYETATQMPSRQLGQWLSQGACFDDLATPGLAEDVQRLKQGKAITDPVTAAVTGPAQFIVLETPLGRAHAATAPVIDLLIWLDIPLDIALARKLRQFTGDLLVRDDPAVAAGFVRWLDTYLDGYINAVGRAMAIQAQQVKPGADIVLDGFADLTQLVARAVGHIRRQWP